MGQIILKTGDSLNFTETASLVSTAGWFDITPFESGDDGTNGAVNTLVTGVSPACMAADFAETHRR